MSFSYQKVSITGKNDGLEMGSIIVCEGSRIFTILENGKSAVLGGLISGTAEKECYYEINGSENVEDCGPDEKLVGIVLFGPYCSMGDTTSGNGSPSSDAGLTREGRNSSGSYGNSGSQRAPCGSDVHVDASTNRVEEGVVKEGSHKLVLYICNSKSFGFLYMFLDLSLFCLSPFWIYFILKFK